MGVSVLVGPVALDSVEVSVDVSKRAKAMNWGPQNLDRYLHEGYFFGRVAATSKFNLAPWGFIDAEH